MEDTHKTGLTALKRLADIGAEEAFEKGEIEPFGHRLKEPERDSVQGTEYERLLEAFYAFGRAGHEHMTPDRFFEEKGFPELAHAIREGWKDCRNENKVRAHFNFDDRLKRNDQKPNQPTTEPEFTEEEIILVRAMRGACPTFSAFAERCDVFAKAAESIGDEYLAERDKRWAACARHLAETEGE